MGYYSLKTKDFLNSTAAVFLARKLSPDDFEAFCEHLEFNSRAWVSEIFKVRISNLLNSHGISDLEALTGCTESEFSELSGIGVKHLNQMKKFLDRIGRKFREPADTP